MIYLELRRDLFFLSNGVRCDCEPSDCASEICHFQILLKADGRWEMRLLALACLAAAAAALKASTTMQLWTSPLGRVRAGKLLAQVGWTPVVDQATGQTYYYNEQTGESSWDPPASQGSWVTGIDEASGQTYYYNQQTGACQWEPPQASPTTQVLWRLYGVSGVAGFSGVNGFVANKKYTHFQMEYEDSRVTGRPCQLPYGLGLGDEKVLSRWNMIEQKFTVDTKQCLIECRTDGTLTATSEGDNPTLWRAPGGQWNVLNKDDRVTLQDGDQIGLDYSDPEGAVFTCVAEL